MKSRSAIKRGFLDGYRTYDSEAEGFGSRQQWQESFYQRFSHDQAQEILNTDSDSPYAILGIQPGATADQIKKAFRSLIMIWHPDKNRDRTEEAEAMSKKIIAAYSLLT